MKTLIKFAALHGLKIVPITYKFNGIRLKRKGYDLINDQNYIQLSFEPKNYRPGGMYADKWLIHNYAGNTMTYIKSLKSILGLFANFKPVEYTHMLYNGR